MAVDENNKKRGRSERYRNLYDAYRDETDADDDEFWSSLGNAKQQEDDDEETRELIRSIVYGDVDSKKTDDEDDDDDDADYVEHNAFADDDDDDDLVSVVHLDEATSAKKTAGKTQAAASAKKTSKKTAMSAEEMSRKLDARDKAKKEEKRKIKRGRRMFLVFLLFWAIVLVVLGAWLWRYTDRCLVDYENSQPENNVARLLEEFKTRVRNGSIEKEVQIEAEGSEFESAETITAFIKNRYLEKLANVQQFTCEKNKNSYSTTNPVYDILGDGEVIAQMRMTSFNPRKILAILEVCDWKIDTITPIVKTDDLVTTGYVYTVPSGYKITVNGKELTQDHIVSTGEVPKDLEYVNKYVTIPTNVTYAVNDILLEPAVVITDEHGEVVDAQKDEKGYINIAYAPKTGIEMPQERYDFALDIAKKWGDFVTNDMPGEKRGLYAMRKYIVTDSDFFYAAESYAKSVDITFISSHTIDKPAYTDLSVTEYTEYTDTCYSCHIEFTKNMHLTKNNNHVTMHINSYFYYVYIDDSDDGVDNPRWALLDMLSATSQTPAVTENAD